VTSYRGWENPFDAVLEWSATEKELHKVKNLTLDREPISILKREK